MELTNKLFEVFVHIGRVCMMLVIILDSFEGVYGRAITFALILILLELQDIDASIRKAKP